MNEYIINALKERNVNVNAIDSLYAMMEYLQTYDVDETIQEIDNYVIFSNESELKRVARSLLLKNVREPYLQYIDVNEIENDSLENSYKASNGFFVSKIENDIFVCINH